MADPYIGEIRIFAGTYAPLHWAFCDGQLLAISQNDALFSLIGTNYGGDGRSSFGLPEMRGRAPVHFGNGPGLTPRPIGQRYGAEEVTLTTAQIPSHSHGFRASTGGVSAQDPTNMVLGTVATDDDIYYEGSDTQNIGAMNADSVMDTGGSQSHYNMMPYLCMNFIMSLAGIYPQRS